MSVQAPFQFARLSELGGQALDGSGDTHLRPGVHLRIAPSPDLGLPVQPLAIARLALGPGRTWPMVRDDIEWIDTRGDRRTTPFTLRPENPVRGYLPRRDRSSCCWLLVRRARGGIVLPTVPLNPFRVPRRAGLTPPGGRRPGPGVPAIGPVDRLGPGARELAPPGGSVRPPPAVPSGPLTVRAFMTTEMGPAVVASRTRAPFEVAATPIEWIELLGSGRVEGVAWLDQRQVLAEVIRRARLPAGDPERIEIWRSLPLPVSDAVRYTGAPPDAREQAAKRVVEGAPARFGLHDVPDVAGPSASPPASPADEEARLGDVTPRLGEYLQDLVSTAEPGNVTDGVPLPPPSDGTLQVPVLPGVQQALGDFGVALWAAHAVVDLEPPAGSGGLVAYAVVGAWQDRDPIEGRPRTRRLGTALCAVVGHPGDRPPPPLVGPPQGGAFLPVESPEARRVVTVRFGGLVPGAGLAVARRTGSEVKGLNKRAPSGRAVPFLPHVPDDAVDFGESKLTDREAPPGAFIYRVAQQDWFGRWSEWSERGAPAAERPPPPAPVVHAVYAAPEVDDPIPPGALAGTISVQVPVPPVASLPPGAHLLDRLELSVDGVLQALPVQDPTDPRRELTLELDGPPLGRAAERSVTLLAHWVDQAGLRSEPSDPRTLLLRDPRPAPTVTIPPGLRYTSRPDVTGRARFRLEWLSGPGQEFFRAFYTDETRLLAALREMGTAAGGGAGGRAEEALAELAEADDPAVRAAVFESVSDLFSRDLFEQLTERPLATGEVGGVLSLEHAVPGALRVLSFYRVVSVTGAQVESSFAEAPLIPVRVPNTLSPPRPTLTLIPRTDTGTGAFVARLRIDVPLGNVAPTEFRVRRAVEGASDVSGMPVVAGGPLQATPEGRRRADLDDRGTAPAGAGLRPWARYVWVAEVRGGAEPGGGPAAEWSRPSAPVAHTFVPPEPPPAPEIVALEVSPGTIELRVTHPDSLRGSLGRGYELEVYRQLQGEAARLVRRIPAGAPESVGGRDATGVFRVSDEPGPPPGTSYRALVRDPLGRAGPATAPVFVTEP